MRRCFVPALVALLAASSASAQDDELHPGARVRISAPGIVADRFEATILARAGDTLVVASQASGPVRIPVARISSLELGRGKSRTEGAIEGMKWGVPIMTAFGLLLGTAASDCSTCRDDLSSGEVVAAFALSGAVYGAGIGALVGKERWDRFDVGIRTSLQVRDGRPALALRIAF